MASRALILCAILFRVIALGQEEPRSSWLSLTEAEKSHASGYKEFMRVAKTELSFVREAVKLARAAGFRELTDDARIEPGACFYDVNRDYWSEMAFDGIQFCATLPVAKDSMKRSTTTCGRSTTSFKSRAHGPIRSRCARARRARIR